MRRSQFNRSVRPWKGVIGTVKLSYVFRRPRYPVLCEVAADILAARSRRQLERRLSRLGLPADRTLRMVDASGEGWGVHLDLSAVSPLVLKKTWTKAELLRLYRESATGQRNGLPYDESRLLKQRLAVVIHMLVDLVEQNTGLTRRCNGPGARDARPPAADRHR